MHWLRVLRPVARLAVVTAFLAPTAAHAVTAEHVNWAGYGYSSCTVGSSTGWDCTFAVNGSDCTEVSAAGVPIASCFVHVYLELKIVPLVNAGRVVGCTTGGAVLAKPASYARFESTFDDFDNGRIGDVVVAQMYDVFGDGRPATLGFEYYDQNESDTGSRTWIVEGAFDGTCQRGSSWVYSSTARGAVDVQI